MRILLIDDHKLIVEGIKNSLSNYMTNPELFTAV